MTFNRLVGTSAAAVLGLSMVVSASAETPQAPGKVVPAAQAPAAPGKSHAAAQAPAAPSKTYPAPRPLRPPARRTPAARRPQLRQRLIRPPRPLRPLARRLRRPGAAAPIKDLSGCPGPCGPWQGDARRPGPPGSYEDLARRPAPAAPGKPPPAGQGACRSWQGNTWCLRAVPQHPVQDHSEHEQHRNRQPSRSALLLHRRRPLPLRAKLLRLLRSRARRKPDLVSREFVNKFRYPGRLDRGFLGAGAEN